MYVTLLGIRISMYAQDASFWASELWYVRTSASFWASELWYVRTSASFFQRKIMINVAAVNTKATVYTVTVRAGTLLRIKYEILKNVKITVGLIKGVQGNHGKCRVRRQLLDSNYDLKYYNEHEIQKLCTVYCTNVQRVT